MAGPRPRKQLLGGSSARRDFAALTVVQNFFGNPNGIGTFKLLEGADADIHSSYLLLLCDVDELSIFPSRAAPTSWSMFRTSIVGVAAVQSRPVQLDSELSCITRTIIPHPLALRTLVAPPRQQAQHVQRRRQQPQAALQRSRSRAKTKDEADRKELGKAV